MEYLTPEEAFEKKARMIEDGVSVSLEEYIRLSKVEGDCEVCGQPIWKLAGCGMCFTCTTGEVDDEDEWDLI